MGKAYTDDERVQITKKEYDNLNENDPVTINNGEKIGYVSKVVNDKKQENKLLLSLTAIPKYKNRLK
ncbi:hypothetical protein [Enterococcus plantarum]|uniref:hypothetical protein n=1 Tax=Enterococcus plantarum TaxID=1077675 RepID=UPI0021AD1E3F|nr:hypothetical protein [Enterococcus plantarum]